MSLALTCAMARIDSIDDEPRCVVSRVGDTSDDAFGRDGTMRSRVGDVHWIRLYGRKLAAAWPKLGRLVRAYNVLMESDDDVALLSSIQVGDCALNGLLTLTVIFHYCWVISYPLVKLYQWFDGRVGWITSESHVTCL